MTTKKKENLVEHFAADKEKPKKPNIETSNLFESEGRFREVLLKEVDELMKRSKSLESVIINLRAELSTYEVRVRELEAIVSSQFDKVQILELYCEKIPGPVWFKRVNDDEITMDFINSKYTEVWGITCEYYEGKTDIDVWGEEVGSKFYNADVLVLKHKRGHKIIEEVPNDPLGADPKFKKWIIWKFPVIDNNKVIGIGGIAIDYFEIKNLKDNYE